MTPIPQNLYCKIYLGFGKYDVCNKPEPNIFIFGSAEQFLAQSNFYQKSCFFKENVNNSPKFQDMIKVFILFIYCQAQFQYAIEVSIELR